MDKVIESSIEKKSERVSYLTLKNPTEQDRLVSVWVDGGLITLTMISSKSEKQILLGTMHENAQIVIKEQQ